MREAYVPTASIGVAGARASVQTVALDGKGASNNTKAQSCGQFLRIRVIGRDVVIALIITFITTCCLTATVRPVWIVID